MHLGEGRSGERLGIDGGEGGVEAAPEIPLDDRPQRLEGPRRDGVVELAELVDERLGQDVGTGAADLGGLGEGAGIIPLEEIAFALEVLYGVETGLEMEKVAELCRQVKKVFGVEYLPTKTFVGDGLYRHSIDSHIASILRGAWHTWECVHPSVVGQERQLEFAFAKIRRGRSGAIAAKIEQMGLVAGDEQLNRIIDEVRTITEMRGWATESEVETVIRNVLNESG